MDWNAVGALGVVAAEQPPVPSPFSPDMNSAIQAGTFTGLDIAKH